MVGETNAPPIYGQGIQRKNADFVTGCRNFFYEQEKFCGVRWLAWSKRRPGSDSGFISTFAAQPHF